MRLPWEKIYMEVVEVSAPELGDKLYPDLDPELAEAAAGWGIVHLVKWGLARCPDHQPPSASAVVPGPAAAKQICRAARWRGAPLEYVRALAALPDPMIEMMPDGIRLRGLDNYDTAWGERHPKEWREWKAAHPEKYPPEHQPKTRRKSAGDTPDLSRTDPDADPDVDGDTEKNSHHHRRESKPDDDDGDGEFLWDSIAFRRNERDLAAELHKPKQWRDFIQRVRADGFTDQQLQRSHSAFLLDDDFRLAGWPSAVWITDKVWRHRVGIPPPKPARDPLTGVRLAQ